MGLKNIIDFGKAQLLESERDLYHTYCFLEKGWISKPSDYDSIDPETRIGLLAIMELESNKITKEENKAKAQEALQGLKQRSVSV